MDNSATMASNIPSSSSQTLSSAFSFTAPFPTSPSSSAKQRRVSLALPSSPRIFPAWSFRDDTGLGVHSADAADIDEPSVKKGKMRKIAVDDSPPEEPSTGLVQAIPLPDKDKPEKKPRKKWTMEETHMLVAGCNKWGVGNWKSILNDPEFRFDGRSPVDLKDRFRTYYPDAYRQHYPNAKTHLSTKVRSALPDGSSIFEKTRSKKRRPFTEEEDRALKAGYDKHGTVWATIVKDPIFQAQNRRSTDLRDRFRNAFPDLYQAAGYKPRNTTKKRREQLMQPARAATDDALASCSSTGPVRRKRRHTDQGLLRGGTKSVPESASVSEDEDSSDEEDARSTFFKDSGPLNEEMAMSPDCLSQEVEMQTLDSLDDTLTIPDFVPSSSLSEMTDSSQTWSSGLDTPVHSSVWSLATNAASPTSSQISTDYFNNSPFNRRNESGPMMIGKSAWGPQDWLSANPRLDQSSGSSSSYIGGFSPAAPSSPFSFAQLSHGVLDRYDLLPTSFAHDFASEVGIGDTHSTFSDPDMFTPSSFRGFTHHSNYAGDLIFGARTHQPPQSADYGPGFGFGSAGLGLSGMQAPPSGNLHPTLRPPALPGIDEIELTSITLDDQVDTAVPMEETIDTAVPEDSTSSEPALNLSELTNFSIPPHGLDEITGLTQEIHVTPPGTPQTHGRMARMHIASHNRSISVPPSEHRAYDRSVPVPQTQQLRPKPLVPTTRSLSHMDYLPQHAQTHSAGGSQASSAVFSSLAQSANELWKESSSASGPGGGGDNTNYDLPFLDLHYYNGAQAGSPSTGQGVDDQATQAQALDLAQSFALQSRTLSQLPPSLVQHIPMFAGWQNALSEAGTAHARMMSGYSHQRGQSVVSPQDLVLTKGDHKRKRSSWDGGAR